MRLAALRARSELRAQSGTSAKLRAQSAERDGAVYVGALSFVLCALRLGAERA